MRSVQSLLTFDLWPFTTHLPYTCTITSNISITILLSTSTINHPYHQFTLYPTIIAPTSLHFPLKYRELKALSSSQNLLLLCYYFFYKASFFPWRFSFTWYQSLLLLTFHVLFSFMKLLFIFYETFFLHDMRFSKFIILMVFFFSFMKLFFLHNFLSTWYEIL